MGIKNFLKNSKLTGKLYARAKDIKNQHLEQKNLAAHMSLSAQFKDRSNKSEKLCVILAGYKEFAYPAVFGRIKRFAPGDMDICVVSSGKFSPELDQLCAENGWSYLSTKENNVARIQNTAIWLHPNARYIYKLDEDVFITEGYFENMLRAYEHAKTGEYEPGIMAPLLNVNGYAHMRILEKLGLKDVFSQRFEPIKYMAGPHRKIENDPEAAKMMWGEGGLVPSIDELNARFGAEPLEERACPIRFSIGAILFERQLWEDMGYLSVDPKGTNMGMDEVEMCSFCLINSRPLMVSENVVVGHLSFGTQNAPMKEYFEEHKELFM